MTQTTILPAITFTIILGMLISLVLTIVIFYQGLLKLPVTNGYRIKTIFMISMALLLWGALAIILGADGFFASRSAAKFQFPKIVYTFIPVIIGIIVLNYSKSFKAIIDAIPLHWLIGIQFLRTAGVVFLIFYFQHLLPGSFALPAGIGDALIGITAPVVAYMYYNKKLQTKNIAMLWNIAGTLDLVLALSMGFLTSPSPVQLFALDNPSRIITTYPLVVIPAFAVPLFILHHIFTFRKLNANTMNS